MCVCMCGSACVWTCICVEAYVRVCTHVFMCGGYVCVVYVTVFMHVEAKGQPQVSFLMHHPSFFEAGSLTSLEPTRQTRLANQ